MPIYEFQCPACGHKEELIQKMSDLPPNCPGCPVVTAQPMQKIFSNTATPQFVGKGFFTNDYRGAKKPR